MTLNSLNDLLINQLRDLFSAETQLIAALPEMIRGAKSVNLQNAFKSHLSETEAQLERLSTIADILGTKLSGDTCEAMAGLIAESAKALQEEGAPELVDGAIIAASQRIEHYEMSAYGTARALALVLGLDEIVELLQETFDEERSADKKLTEIARQEVLEFETVLDRRAERTDTLTRNASTKILL